MLFAVSEAADRLGFDQISGLIAMFIHFGANILLGAVILVIGFWLANVVANVVQRGEYNSSRWLGSLVRVLIIGLVLALGLRAMGIADSIVNLAFGLTLGAVAVAFALAFGLGGRQPAERLLSDLLDKAKKKRMNQIRFINRLLLRQQAVHLLVAHLQLRVRQHLQLHQRLPHHQRFHLMQNQLILQVNPAEPPVNKPFGSTGENDEI